MKNDKKKAIEYIIAQIKKGRTEIDKIKREAAEKYKVEMIKNSEVLKVAKEKNLSKDKLDMLLKKPVRTRSGITTIAVMIKPEASCIHGCIYCPYTGKAAKSYTGEEPAALRSRNAGFDPVKQVKSRLKQYKETGHPTDKCEVIVMGGTFLETDEKYKQKFIKKIYDTLNGKAAKTIEAAKKLNERAKHRVVGLTIETRPDVCGEKQVDEMLGYGATRVELGVQHPDNNIYKIINRGHGITEVVKATSLLKDSTFKVLYHIMPGLPESDKNLDIEMAKKLFHEERFKPDMLKIYPTLTIKGTKLYKMMKKGKYTPYTAEEAADIIAEMFRYIPKYCRVMRIQRDIPANLIDAGVKKSNLRELVEEKMKNKKIKPLEIRSREIGLQEHRKEDFEIRRLNYYASGGRESFISYENDEVIAGFVRLRFPGTSTYRDEITRKTGLIRELHVYGREEKLGSKGEVQHTGIGKQLLAEAENVARKEGMEKMIILSGTGVRPYYRKLGYKLEGPYVSKKLGV